MVRGGKREGAGRPRLYKAALSTHLTIKLTPQQKAAIERKAAKAKQSVQSWTRERLDSAPE